MSDKKIKRKYAGSGAHFGEAVSYLYMGECVEFESKLNRWADWEQEYAKRGYRTIPLDNFIELGGYDKNIDPLFMIKLDKKEKPIFYAQIYREKYLGKIMPVINLEKIIADREIQTGTYILPSTKNSP